MQRRNRQSGRFPASLFATWSTRRPGARATDLAGAIVVPIFRGDLVIGALGIANRTERAFTGAELAELMQVGRKIAERR